MNVCGVVVSFARVWWNRLSRLFLGMLCLLGGTVCVTILGLLHSGESTCSFASYSGGLVREGEVVFLLVSL